MTNHVLGKLVKAAYTAATAALTTLSTILIGRESLGDVTDGQWIAVALLALTAGGGTYGLAAWRGPKLNGGNR